MRIAVTGGSGKLGRSVVRRLDDAGHEVMNLDRDGDRSPGLALVDLRDYGQVVDAILGMDDRHTGFDAIVHLGAVRGSSRITGRHQPTYLVKRTRNTAPKTSRTTKMP